MQPNPEHQENDADLGELVGNGLGYFEFFFPSDKLGQAAGVLGFEAALDGSPVAMRPTLLRHLRYP